MKTIKLNLIVTVLQFVIISFLVFIAIGSFATRIPFLSRLGFNFFAVTSGSMQPTIPTGSLIYSGRYKLNELKKKDIITYYLRDDKTKDVSIVTHRIVDVIKEESKVKVGEKGKQIEKKIVKYEFATKGDANNIIDQRLVPSANIIGLYKWHIPKLGFMTHFAQSPKGFVMLIIIPAVVLIAWEVFDVILHFKKKYEEKARDEIEALKLELGKKKKKTKK